MRGVLGLTLTALVLGSAGSASADAPKTASLRLFAELDTNHDSRITRDELLNGVTRHLAHRVQRRFHQLDKNGDTFVTRAEVPGMAPDRFARFDLNYDGSFTQAELAAVMYAELAGRMSELLAELDSDGDHVCSLSELDAHRHRLALRRLAGKERVASGDSDSTGQATLAAKPSEGKATF